jgi:DNA-binding MarR family transcriptional regulator
MHNDMTVLQVRTFFLVAAYPGSTQKAIFKALDSNDSAVSRAMAVLSHAPEKPGRKKGLGLVEYRENPNDRREKFMTLSPRGKREWADIMRDLA